MQNNIVRLFLFIILSAAISLALPSQNIFSQRVLAQSSDTPFTVMTYNIGMINPDILGADPDAYIEKLATYISQKQPQIISLQEVVEFTQYKQNGTLQPYNYNTFEQLKSKLRSKGWEMNGTYSETWELSNDERNPNMRGSFGAAILVRGSVTYPTTVHRLSEIHSSGAVQNYTLFETPILYENQPITVFSSHPHPGETSCLAAVKMMNKINAVTGFKLLLGDLNMPPWAQCFETYLANDTMADACLTSWNNAGNYSIRDTTCNNSVNKSFHSTHTDALIDHVIYSTNTVNGVAFNIESVRVDTSNVNSDHFPLIASLKLYTPAATPRTATVAPTDTPSPTLTNPPLPPPIIPISNIMDPDSINPVCSADGWSATYRWNKPTDTRINEYWFRANYMNFAHDALWLVADGTDIFSSTGNVESITLPIIPFKPYVSWSVQSVIAEEPWTHPGNQASIGNYPYLYSCLPQSRAPSGSCLETYGDLNSALTSECTFENWISEFKLQYGYDPTRAMENRSNPYPQFNNDGRVDLLDFEILRQKKYTIVPTATIVPTFTPTPIPATNTPTIPQTTTPSPVTASPTTNPEFTPTPTLNYACGNADCTNKMYPVSPIILTSSAEEICIAKNWGTCAVCHVGYGPVTIHGSYNGTGGAWADTCPGPPLSVFNPTATTMEVCCTN